ncbi:MAG: CopG family antitoxin, partial [Candidatus Poribacteria bacterium]|nr:CopG family antitoxin [Candidatus Poribacteria bacterium]
MNHTKIPQTDSIQELAEFWDTHDLTDFEDELEEVSEPVFDNSVSVQLESKELEIIETLAKSRGISPE